MLQPLVERCQAECGVKLSLTAKPKQEDGAAQMQAMIDAIKAAASPEDTAASITVGTLPKDKHEGKMAALFAQLFGGPESGLALVDVSTGVADLLACKDAAEVLNVKKAAMLASKVGIKEEGQKGGQQRGA